MFDSDTLWSRDIRYVTISISNFNTVDLSIPLIPLIQVIDLFDTVNLLISSISLIASIDLIPYISLIHSISMMFQYQHHCQIFTEVKFKSNLL